MKRVLPWGSSRVGHLVAHQLQRVHISRTSAAEAQRDHDDPVPELGSAPPKRSVDGATDGGVYEEVGQGHSPQARYIALCHELACLQLGLPTSAPEEEAMAFPPGAQLRDHDGPVPELGVGPCPVAVMDGDWWVVWHAVAPDWASHVLVERWVW